MNDCIFCKIINKEAPAKIEFENDSIIAFRNINPIAPVHLLIVPKKHVENISDLSTIDRDTMGDIILTIKKLAEKIGIKEAFRVGVANGKNAGQSVFHLHFHLTGGWKEKYLRDEDKA